MSIYIHKGNNRFNLELTNDISTLEALEQHLRQIDIWTGKNSIHLSANEQLQYEHQHPSNGGVLKDGDEFIIVSKSTETSSTGTVTIKDGGSITIKGGGCLVVRT